MDQSCIDRINTLAKLAKERALTEEEQAERGVLRKEYIDAVKASLTGHLDNTYFVEKDGTQAKLKKKD